MAAYIHCPAWTNPTSMTGGSGLSGSSIWSSLMYIYENLSGYWIDGTTANQYVVTDTQITGATGWNRYLQAGSDFTISSAPISFVASVPTGSGWLTYVDEILTTSAVRIDFGISGGGTLNFGYASVVAGSGATCGNPTSPYGNNPDNLNGAWGTMLGPDGLNSVIFSAGPAMTGNNGWLDRFYTPYLGIKQAMKIYNDALYTATGWVSATMTTAQKEPWLPCGTPSALIPISSNYAYSGFSACYYDISEYMYGRATADSNLSALSAHMTIYGNNLNATGTSGTVQQAYFSNTSTATSAATYNFLSAAGDKYTDNDYTALWTGDDDSVAGEFRNLQSIAQLRLSWDKDHVKIPLSAFTGTSAAIWDTGTKFVMLYLLKQHTDYDVVRDILSG